MVEKVLSSGKTIPEFLKEAKAERRRTTDDGYSSQKEDDAFWKHLAALPNGGLPDVSAIKQLPKATVTIAAAE